MTSISVLVLFACGTGEPDGRTEITVDAWETTPTPRVSIGVVEGDEALQLANVVDAGIVDETIVIANGGTQELRYFDMEGNPIRSVGGRGRGPAEFSTLNAIVPAGPDSMLILESFRREVYLSVNGEFLSSTPLNPEERDPFASDTWLYRNALVKDALPGPDRDRARRVVDRISPITVAAGYAFVVSGPDQTTWVKQNAGTEGNSQTWLGFDQDAEPLAWVSLPSDWEVFELSREGALGKRLDENDVEFVEFYEFTSGATDPRSVVLGSDAVRSEEPLSRDEALAALRLIVTAQEAHYADNLSYARRAGDLSIAAGTLPDGLTFDLIEAGATGWFMVVTRPDSPTICAAGVGLTVPYGWPEGVPVCAES